MDVCVLAGGLGTRLAGVWSGPKCLAPVAGVPLLERLIKKVAAEVESRRIVISVGWQTKGADVIHWWETRSFPAPCEVLFAMEPVPIGRLRALIACLPALTPPVLVLNGDTLPQFNLFTLGRLAMMAVSGEPWKYAGAFILDAIACNALMMYRDSNYDLEEVVDPLIVPRIDVHGFLDIGTPEGFAAAQQLDTAEG